MVKATGSSGSRPPARRSPGPKPRRLIETAGPTPGTPTADVRLMVGTIVGAFGVQGEAKLKPATDHPEHLAKVKQAWFGADPRPKRLLGARMHKGMVILRIFGVTTPEAVDVLRGTEVRIAGADAAPLAPGEYFYYQLIGLRAEDDTGAVIGTVSDIMETGAHDVLVITPEGGGADILVPNHPSYVREIDPAAGRMVVTLPVYE